MIDAPLALAFTAGMLATVNPCGFAMLPAYLGYFLGIEASADADDATAGILWALVVGAVVSAGFLAVFAIMGGVVSWTSLSVGDISPWFTVVIGAALVIVGIRFLTGWEPNLHLPKLDKGGRTRGLGSMFVFGVSYAIASLSCTIGPFTAVVASTFSRASVLSGMVTFVAYAAGMALLLMVLTVALAAARRGMVVGLRKALPYVQRTSGAIMVLMGAYLAWYGVYEIRLNGSAQASGQGPVRLVTAWSADIQNRLAHLDAITVALVLGLVLVAVVLVALLRSTSHPTPPADVPES